MRNFKYSQIELLFFRGSSKYDAFLILFWVLGLTLFDLLGIFSVMPFLAVAADPEILYTHQTLNILRNFLNTYHITDPIIIILILGCTSAALIFISSVFRIFAYDRIFKFIEMRRKKLSSLLFKNYIYQPYQYFIENHTDKLSKTLLAEIDQIIGFLINPLIFTFAHLVISICIVIFLAMMNPLVAFTAFVTIGGVYSLYYSIINKKIHKLGLDLSDANQKRFSIIGDAFGGIKTVKILKSEHVFCSSFEHSNARYAISLAQQQVYNQTPKFVIEAVAFGGLILIILGLIVQEGDLSGGALGLALPVGGMYALAAYRLQPSLHAIYNGLANLKFGRKLLEDLETQFSNSSPPVMESVETKSLFAVQKIQIKDLSFKYPNVENFALKDINLTVNVGETIAIIGSTGSGKTTLVDFLMGLLTNKEINIFVDDTPVTSINLGDWQRSLGYVPQDVFLVDSSISENIAWGIEKDEIDQNRVERAAQLAQIHDFILALDDKYETTLGERGVRISGGQRQRIGIARALYFDPKIIVFDEATSALDEKTEFDVINSILKLAKKKTVIIVTHRLSMARLCDNIFVLNNGRMVAKGSYEELELNNKLPKKRGEF